MKRHILFLFLILFLIYDNTNGQSILKDEYDSLKNIDYNQLKKIAIDLANEKEWLVKKVYADGSIVELQYIDKHGNPVYLQTDNLKAATTTGTVSLHPNGDLGLNLLGHGMKVGVWDGGGIRVSHVELQNRTQQLDNPSDISLHATHVTGTIIARGINPVAIGMAPEASAITFDFNGDIGEMSKYAEQGLLLSNHSYGQQLGWSYNPENNSWSWMGDNEVSTSEDYRFGLYSSLSRSMDIISYENPFYLMVKSSGNDRSDVGNGTGAPPDGPYDILGPRSVAKNVLTVGAVNAITEYKSPKDVVISSFSSWGPTDDGRIKPDIVGDGVNLISTSSEGDDQYTTLSGTSMSAPNVTGSLLLLQELYQKVNNRYMLASSLKGLVIHTSHEAGNNPGPDYQFGWGLLNAKAAAKQILLDKKEDFLIIEDTLSNNEIYTLQFDVTDAGTEIKTTLCWTDVPGAAITGKVLNPTTLNLINDLDLRVYGPDEVTFLPWKIDPGTKAVSKGDNFRDNVEKIEFKAPAPGKYVIEIKHKGETLQDNRQIFSVIHSTSNHNDNLQTFYFKNLSPDLNVAGNWSKSPGGPSGDGMPGKNDIVIFDGALYNEKEITISGDINEYAGISIRNLDSLKINGTFNINSFLAVSKAHVSFEGTIGVGNGSFAFIDIKEGNVDINKFRLTSEGIGARVSGKVSFDSLFVDGGKFFVENAISVAHLSINGTEGTEIDISNIEISQLKYLNITGEFLDFNDDNTIYSTSESDFADFNINEHINNVKVNASELYLKGFGSLKSINFPDKTTIDGNILINDLNLSLTNEINFIGESSLFIVKTHDTNNLKVIDDGGMPSTIVSNEMLKICWQDIIIDGVDVEGSTNFVVDVESIVINGTGWIIANCEDVLEAAYSVVYLCSKGLTTFKDESEGSPELWEWYSNNELISRDSIFNHSFTDPGEYEIKLIVKKDNGISTLISNLKVIPSTLGIPTVLENTTSLRSSAFANNYQWFHNGDSIEGANDFQLFDYHDPGFYSIDIWDNTCKMRSTPYEVIVLDIDAEEILENQFSIYPNPVEDELFINHHDSFSYKIYNINGKLLLEGNELSNNSQNHVDVSGLEKGMYLILLKDQEEKVFVRKFLKQK